MTPRVFVVLVLGFGCRGSSDSQPAQAPGSAKPVAAKTAPAAGDGWPSLLSLDTGAVYVSASSFAVEADPPEALWSRLAFVVCHEDDPFGMFMALGASASEPRDAEHARAGLRCGRAVAAKLPAGSRAHILQLDPAASSFPRPIQIVPTTLAGIADLATELRGFRRETVGASEVLCRPFDPTEQTCAERANEYDKAVAWKRGHLVAGSYVAVARFLAWPDADRVLAALQAATGPIELDVVPPETRWTIGPRRWLPYTEGIEREFAAAVRTHARAVGWERSETGGAIVLAPRCATAECSERDTLLAAFRAYHAAWKTSAPQRMNQLMAENPGPETDCARPAEEALVQAIARAEVKPTPAGFVELRYTLAGSKPASEDCAASDRDARAAAAARVRSVLGEPSPR